MEIYLRTPQLVETAPVLPQEPFAFHQNFFGYRPTRLVEVPELANKLGFKRLLIKNETQRFGLPSFKILGVSWATYKLLKGDLGSLESCVITPEVLKTWAKPIAGQTLVCASDGNHGFAVATMAKWMGLRSKIFLPRSASRDTVEFIEGQSAEVILVKGTYDDAVDEAENNSILNNYILISDTGRTDDDQVPKWIIDGYSTMFHELDSQLLNLDVSGIDLISVQAGVGAFASSFSTWTLQPGHCSKPPGILTVEPASAPCVMEALKASRPVTIIESNSSKMNFLQCGTVSVNAYHILKLGVSACMAIEDQVALDTAAELRKYKIFTGPSGACGLAGLKNIFENSIHWAELRAHLKITNTATALVFVTELPMKTDRL